MMLVKVESYFAICLKSEGSILSAYILNGTGVCSIFEKQTLGFAEEYVLQQIPSEAVERYCWHCPLESEREKHNEEE